MCRRAIGLRIKENKEVDEGEVTEITPEESASSGYGKVLQFVVVGLKTVKGTKQLKLDPTIYDSILKEKVQVSRKTYTPPDPPDPPGAASIGGAAGALICSCSDSLSVSSLLLFLPRWVM